MKSTILYKFLTSYITIVALGFFGVAIISYHMDYNKCIESTSERMYEEAMSITNSYANYFYRGSVSPENLHLQLCTLADYNNTVIMFLSNSGEILLSTDTPFHPKSNITVDGFDPVLTGNKRYVLGNFHGYFNEEYLSVIAPVSMNFSIRGYVMIHKSTDSIKTDMASLFNTNYFTLFMCMCLASIFIFLAYFEIHKPIREITHAVKEYGHGNLTYQLKKYDDDDIGRLAAALNYMSEKLNESDESQKKFIANVSHDFRSPLTSIKGYLEAILDGTIPHEMQDKYLNIVISETDRLSKLTNNLLTLNNVDFKKNRLSYEPFDINMKIKRSIETFEGTCKEKGIKFDLTFSDKATVVYADPEKINQVIYNLIDNAIKFSHHDSIIYINVAERGEKAFISVKDTGIGIPKDSINKIWDRFYKTDQSRGKDKKGTGLGLAIVKDIIQAHQENIDVISTEGAGTEFIFSLTRYVEKE